jgi:hypothetical protein
MNELWFGIAIGIFVNLTTGLLLSIVFETLQRRRDLQTQLGELWLLATRASEAVSHSGLRKDEGAEAYTCWLALQDEWLRARHSLNFALSSDKRKQLEESISAIYELHILNSDTRNQKFIKTYSAAASASLPEAPEPIDYGTWAMQNGQPDEKAAYDEFQAQREELNKKIEYLLHFDPFASPSRRSGSDTQSLPDELAQTWHFGFLFSRVWRWFFSELFYSVSKIFRV